MSDTNLVWVVVALAVLAVAVIASVAFARRSKERSRMLRERFGPEYERTVQTHGLRNGERMLAARVARVEKIKIRELSDFYRQRFLAIWSTIQAQFVDDPRSAVRRANDLIVEVMRVRGYETNEPFEERAADLSVDHPEMAEHYRAARALARRGNNGEALNTEDLRQAVVHYRALFSDLLEPSRVLRHAKENEKAEDEKALRPAHA